MSKRTLEPSVDAGDKAAQDTNFFFQLIFVPDAKGHSADVAFTNAESRALVDASNFFRKLYVRDEARPRGRIDADLRRQAAQPVGRWPLDLPAEAVDLWRAYLAAETGWLPPLDETTPPHTKEAVYALFDVAIALGLNGLQDVLARALFAALLARGTAWFQVSTRPPVHSDITYYGLRLRDTATKKAARGAPFNYLFPATNSAAQHGLSEEARRVLFQQAFPDVETRDKTFTYLVLAERFDEQTLIYLLEAKKDLLTGTMVTSGALPNLILTALMNGYAKLYDRLDTILGLSTVHVRRVNEETSRIKDKVTTLLRDVPLRRASAERFAASIKAIPAYRALYPWTLTTRVLALLLASSTNASLFTDVWNVALRLQGQETRIASDVLTHYLNASDLLPLYADTPDSTFAAFLELAPDGVVSYSEYLLIKKLMMEIWEECELLLDSEITDTDSEQTILRRNEQRTVALNGLKRYLALLHMLLGSARLSASVREKAVDTVEKEFLRCRTNKYELFDVLLAHGVTRLALLTRAATTISEHADALLFMLHNMSDAEIAAIPQATALPGIAPDAATVAIPQKNILLDIVLKLQEGIFTDSLDAHRPALYDAWKRLNAAMNTGGKSTADLLNAAIDGHFPRAARFVLAAVPAGDAVLGTCLGRALGVVTATVNEREPLGRAFSVLAHVFPDRRVAVPASFFQDLVREWLRVYTNVTNAEDRAELAEFVGTVMEDRRVPVLALGAAAAYTTALGAAPTEEIAMRFFRALHNRQAGVAPPDISVLAIEKGFFGLALALLTATDPRLYTAPLKDSVLEALVVYARDQFENTDDAKLATTTLEKFLLLFYPTMNVPPAQALRLAELAMQRGAKDIGADGILAFLYVNFGATWSPEANRGLFAAATREVLFDVMHTLAYLNVRTQGTAYRSMFGGLFAAIRAAPAMQGIQDWESEPFLRRILGALSEVADRVPEETREASRATVADLDALYPGVVTTLFEEEENWEEWDVEDVRRVLRILPPTMVLPNFARVIWTLSETCEGQSFTSVMRLAWFVFRNPVRFPFFNDARELQGTFADKKREESLGYQLFWIGSFLGNVADIGYKASEDLLRPIRDELAKANMAWPGLIIKAVAFASDDNVIFTTDENVGATSLVYYVSLLPKETLVTSVLDKLLQLYVKDFIVTEFARDVAVAIRTILESYTRESFIATDATEELFNKAVVKAAQAERDDDDFATYLTDEWWRLVL